MANPNGNPGNLVSLPQGPPHPRWNEDAIVSDHGYRKVRVGTSHPLADPNGYAYEHLVVWVSAGNARPGRKQVLHHRNEHKQDNRIENLELISRSRHGQKHAPSSLPDESVRAIRIAYDTTEKNTTDLAKEFGIPQQTVWKLIKGVTRRDAGGPIQSGKLRGKKKAGRLLDSVEHNGFPIAETVQ